MNTELEKRQSARSGFTLIEMLTVIAIVGILAGIAGPSLSRFRASAIDNATRQLLDDLGRARQLAMSHRTTVYMVFVPNRFDLRPERSTWTQQDWQQASNLFDKQLVGYNFVTLRSLGDQPGDPTPRYLSEWRTMPSGTFIAEKKFLYDSSTVAMILNNGAQIYTNYGFHTNNSIPFPLATTKQVSDTDRFVNLPYIAFNHVGRLIQRIGEVEYELRTPEIIPLAEGSASFARNLQTKAPVSGPATLKESPPGNSTNAFNVVVVDWLTGRARAQHQEIQ